LILFRFVIAGVLKFARGRMRNLGFQNEADCAPNHNREKIELVYMLTIAVVPKATR
jgi:hypothetical protein